MSEHKNPLPGENNTGHFWDEENDIRELNNRPPRWYMLSLYIGIFAIVAYTLYYPTIPWFGGHNKGFASWTQISEMNESITQLEAYREKRFADTEKSIAEKSLEEIVLDDELRAYAIKTAKVLFGDNCAACHGSAGQGNVGFPVLADDDWLYGGKLSQISTTIANGRKGNMPARMLGISDADANTLATFLIETGKGKNGNPDPASKALYMSKGCIACHGQNSSTIQSVNRRKNSSTIQSVNRRKNSSTIQSVNRRKNSLTIQSVNEQEQELINNTKCEQEKELINNTKCEQEKELINNTRCEQEKELINNTKCDQEQELINNTKYEQEKELINNTKCEQEQELINNTKCEQVQELINNTKCE